VFISHDLAVVEHVCDRVAVMYLGRIVDLADTADLYGQQSHPYTEALISAAPEPDPDRRRQRIVLSGDPPSPESPPPGCPFHPRCPKVMERCHSEVPAERDIGRNGRRHLVRCHLY
jgi:oligopeptide/dipeptide ABC transporter ATP-binding protein